MNPSRAAKAHVLPDSKQRTLVLLGAENLLCERNETDFTKRPNYVQPAVVWEIYDRCCHRPAMTWFAQAFDLR